MDNIPQTETAHKEKYSLKKKDAGYLAAVENGETRYSLKGVFDYDSLAAKKDVGLAVIDDTVKYAPNPQTRKQIVRDALENAKRVGGTNRYGGVFVHVFHFIAVALCVALVHAQ